MVCLHVVVKYIKAVDCTHISQNKKTQLSPEAETQMNSEMNSMQKINRWLSELQSPTFYGLL